MDREMEEMLNNISNDLDILLSEFCELHDPEPGEPPPNRNRPMKVFGKKPMHFENCSAFGGSSTSGTLTSTDSNISNKDVHSGTLTSTDSNNSVTKPHNNYSLQSAHLDVLGISPNRALEPAVYPDKQQSLSRSTSGSDLRQITVLERLTKTHPIWFLPQVGRSGAVHLLKNRDIGIFIVRKSSRDDIMALSVQFPSQDGTQNVDHYLIEPTELGLHLQGSSRLFNAVPNLIAHYCDNKEDLPHRLVLPPAIRTAKTSQELTALAMLGQDFWTSSKYDAPSCSSSRSNLSEHSSIMNKSQSEPISISSKNYVPAYSQSDALIPQQTPTTSQLDEMLLQHTPPKHSVIDFSSYLIQKPSKPLIEIAQHFSHQNLSSISESVHSKCSVTGSKSTQSFLFKQEGNHVTTKSHVTRSSSLHEESIPQERMVLHVNDKENRVDIHIANRDSQISVPYAKPNKDTNKIELEHESVTQVDYLHIPEEYYFRSNLSDKLSDYEDIWKNNYADPKVGNVQADILHRLQPNFVNGNGPRSPTSPGVPTTTFHEQCFSHKCLTTDLNVSLDKLTISNDLTTTKDVTAKLSIGATDQTTKSAPIVSDPNTQKNPSVLKRRLENCVTCTTPLHGVAGNKPIEVKHIDAVLANTGFDSILEHDSDLDIDSNHGDSCHSDNDADADTEDPDAEPQNSVHTQTSLSWNLKSLARCARKSVSTSSLSAMKSPVYSEPFDAINPEKKVNGLIPRIPKKLRRRSAPAIGGMAAKRRLPSTECSKLSPFVYEREKTAEESAESDPEISNDVEDVFQISLELKKENGFDRTCENESEHAYEKAWVEQISASDKDTVSIGNKINKPKPIPRKSKVKKPNLLQEALINQRNKQEATIRNSQNDSIDSPGNIMDQFEFLDDLDENQNRTSPTVGKFPVFYRHVVEDQKVMYSEGSTAEDIITSWNPELTLRPVKPFPVFGTLSEYDNLNNPYIATSGLSMDSAGTTFCNPWENSVLGKIMKTHSQPAPPIPVTAPPIGHASPPLPSLDPRERIEAWRKSSQKYHSVQIDTEDERRLSLVSDANSIDAVTFGGDRNSLCNLRVSSFEQHSRSQSYKTLVNEKSTIHSGAVTERCSGNIPLFGADFQEKVAHVLAQPRLLNKSDRNRNPDRAIRDYIISLSNDRTTTFGSTIENFIQCTLESQDTSPHNITRNVRQFMTGIKNYLVKHGEGELEDLIERERNQLGKNEILNIDAIIEGTLHACVLQPLKQNIYRLFVNEYTRNGNLRLLSSNIKYARTKTAEEIGIRKGLSAPDGPTLELIKYYFTRMQKSYSPLKKLEHLLAATSSIYKCVAAGQQGNSSPPGFGADDFLPMLIYVLVQCGMVSVEIEADYMWGLLHPSLLNGEGGYYLTSLSSAVLVLKNFRQMQETKASQQEGKLPSISDTQGFLKIAIPDEQRDTIMWRTLPVRPSMTTRDVCSMIAHKFKITNPQDYGLYTLEHGEEHKLMEMESPQKLKADRFAHKKDCIFAYKRNAANIAWPKSVQ